MLHIAPLQLSYKQNKDQKYQQKGFVECLCFIICDEQSTSTFHCFANWQKELFFEAERRFHHSRVKSRGRKSHCIIHLHDRTHTHSTNCEQRREISFGHVAKPLSLLILMAEVFFFSSLLSVCLFSPPSPFLFSWMLRAGLGPRLPGRHSDILPLYLCGMSPKEKETPLPTHSDTLLPPPC